MTQHQITSCGDDYCTHPKICAWTIGVSIYRCDIEGTEEPLSVEAVETWHNTISTIQEGE